jgi:hypothetical protein
MDYRKIFLNILFNEGVNCWVYTASVIIERNMSVEYWKNDSERENKRAWRKHFFLPQIPHGPSLSIFS